MFISAVISFVLYTLVYLRLRGNVVVHGIHIRFRMRRASLSWQGSEQGIQDEHIMVIARQMLLFVVSHLSHSLDFLADFYLDILYVLLI